MSSENNLAMGGELSVLSGDIGQTIASRFFEICGWVVGEHIQYECNIERHKNKKGNPKSNHDLDAIYQYPSDFNHDKNNTVCISVKHNIDRYDSSRKGVLNQAIKDLSQCLECGRISGNLNRLSIEARGRKTSYIGVLMMINSDQDSISYNLIEKQFASIKIPRLEKFKQIYIIDNNRASFIYSAIQHSKLNRSDAKLKFLYHHTGLNQNPDRLAYSGTVMQVEQLGNSILPIIMESESKTSLFLFVNEMYTLDSLKRILWLAIKLGGGFVEIRIYFKKFKYATSQLEIASVKNEFKDQDTLSRTTIHNLDILNFAALVEDGVDEKKQTKVPERTTEKPANIDNRAENDSTIDKILPYGTMIKPLLSSSQLSYSDLRNFLTRKGIICKASEKQDTIPIFASIIWQPSDIDELRLLLTEKEDKPKNITYTTTWQLEASTSLREAFLEIQDYVPELPLASNCTVINEPKFIPISRSRIELELEIERVNKTKDLLTGTYFSIRKTHR